MKRLLPPLLIVTLIATGCSRGSPSQKPVRQTYVHKYGVSVDKKEWQARGEHGKVISTRKDGVTVVYQYDNGKLHGESTFSFPHSDLIAKTERYEQGHLVSETDHFHTGSRRHMIEYAENQQTITTWFEEGTPRSRETLRGDHLIAGEYFSPKNLLEGKVEAGEGTRIMRDAQGNLKAEDLISEGVIARQTTFYSNGEPQTITHYHNGIVHGEKRTYLIGGLPDRIEHYNQGILDGTMTLFTNGEKVAEIPYTNGHRNGVELRYTQGEELCEETTWVNDVRHGANNYYVNGGISTDWYHHGQVVNEKAFASLNPVAQ